MLLEFDKPLNISQFKIGDRLIVAVAEQTPFEPELSLFDIDDEITPIFGPRIADVERNGKLYWIVDIDSSSGITESKKYFSIVIDDEEMTGFDSKKFIIYVNDEKNLEDMIIRSSGLAGNNIRKFNHVYTKGLLTSFEIKIYDTPELLQSAEDGESDTFIAHYKFAAKYNTEFNRTEITSIKQ